MAHSSQEQRHFRDLLCTPVHAQQERRQDSEGAPTASVLALPAQNSKETIDKPPKATSSTLYYCPAGLSFAQVLFCSFIASPCWSSGPQVAAPFLPLRCAPFSSAWLDLAQLSSCGLGSIQWDWESPHEAIPCRCCHPTPIDLCFAAFLSAPHPLTALWRKGQRQRRDQTHRGTSQHSY